MKNCALVEELRLGIDKNLNILTGETGSGKSIIIDALGLCLGEKYDRSFLRKGTDKGVVETVFYSDSSNLKRVLHENDLDLDEDNLLIITRVIYSDGKSVARVNGRTVKLSVLKDIASTLIDVHGQHQNQALFNKETHLDFLDLFGEFELQKYLQQEINQLRSIDDGYTFEEFYRKVKTLGLDLPENEEYFLNEEIKILVAKKAGNKNKNFLKNDIERAVEHLNELEARKMQYLNT